MTIRTRVCNFFNSGTMSKVTINDVFLKAKGTFWSDKLFCVFMLCILAFLTIQAFTGIGLEILSTFTSYEAVVADSTIYIWTLTEYIMGFTIGIISTILLFIVVMSTGYCVIKFFKLFEKPFVYIISVFKSIFSRVGSIKLMSCDLKDD